MTTQAPVFSTEEPIIEFKCSAIFDFNNPAETSKSLVDYVDAVSKLLNTKPSLTLQNIHIDLIHESEHRFRIQTKLCPQLWFKYILSEKLNTFEDVIKIARAWVQKIKDGTPIEQKVLNRRRDDNDIFENYYENLVLLSNEHWRLRAQTKMIRNIHLLPQSQTTIDNLVTQIIEVYHLLHNIIIQYKSTNSSVKNYIELISIRFGSNQRYQTNFLLNHTGINALARSNIANFNQIQNNLLDPPNEDYHDAAFLELDTILPFERRLIFCNNDKLQREFLLNRIENSEKKIQDQTAQILSMQAEIKKQSQQIGLILDQFEKLKQHVLSLCENKA